MNNQGKLMAIAHIASAEGLQVTFKTETVTEGGQAGRTLRSIIISAYDNDEE